jgi:threonine/homoserine/homoserine lactone efflux protein
LVDVGLDRPLNKRRARVLQIANVLGFMAVSFIAVVTPGPDVILAMSNGSRFGVRRALPGMFAVLLSDFMMIVGVAAGFGVLLAASALWFSVLKFVGAGYLAYLGIKMLRSGGGLSEALRTNADIPTGTSRSIALRSLIVAVTNPKAYVFFSALVPQFIDTAGPQSSQYVVLAIAFAITELVIMVGYALAGKRAAQLLRLDKIVWLERICGGALLASAGSLMLVRRATVTN